VSFCRWSSDDFQCDLYVYGAEGDVVSINVAGRKHVLKEPLPPEISYDDDPGGWFARHNEVMRVVGDADMEPIGLDCDGETYSLPPEEAADKVRELIAMGYRCDPAVPDEIEADYDV